MRKTPEWKIKAIKKMASEGIKQDTIEEALNISHWTVQKYDSRKVGRGKKSHLKEF